jgi:hypothetical protein
LINIQQADEFEKQLLQQVEVNETKSRAAADKYNKLRLEINKIEEHWER